MLVRLCMVECSLHLYYKISVKNIISLKNYVCHLHSMQILSPMLMHNYVILVCHIYNICDTHVIHIWYFWYIIHVIHRQFNVHKLSETALAFKGYLTGGLVGLIGPNTVLQAQQIYNIAVILKLLWPLQAIRTDGLVGLIGSNKVLPTLTFRLTSFGKPAFIILNM